MPEHEIENEKLRIEEGHHAATFNSQFSIFNSPPQEARSA